MEKYTKYEIARMIGSRALQISMGAPFLVKMSEKDLEAVGYNPIEIAKKEFEKGVLPITVRRPKPKKTEKKETKPAA
jgi:DNA-directed RNA polymerase subunit K